MDKQLDFYQVDADYIAYLLKFDSRVPKVDYSAIDAYEKFLCGIVLSIHGHDYFTPNTAEGMRTRFTAGLNSFMRL